MSKKQYLRPVTETHAVKTESMMIRQSTDEQQAMGLQFFDEENDADWEEESDCWQTAFEQSADASPW